MVDSPYHYACDWRWWDIHYEDVQKNYKGQSYTIQDMTSLERNPNPRYNIKRLKARFGGGLDKEWLHYGIHGGQNSAFQATNLAYILGAKTVILLGIDCFGVHFFGNHPEPLANSSPYHKFIESWATIKEIEVINCSRSTLLDVFPRKRLEDVL